MEFEKSREFISQQARLVSSMSVSELRHMAMGSGFLGVRFVVNLNDTSQIAIGGKQSHQEGIYAWPHDTKADFWGGVFEFEPSGEYKISYSAFINIRRGRHKLVIEDQQIIERIKSILESVIKNDNI